uniref:Hypotheticial protein n=1 Tax=Schistosoma mansoni TaxID=6183 RepID=A0A5K4F6J1_SCHMA
MTPKCLEKCYSNDKYMEKYCNIACSKRANPQYFYCNLACEHHKNEASAVAQSIIDDIIAHIGYEYCIFDCALYKTERCEDDCFGVSAITSKCYRVCDGKHTSLEALCFHTCEWKKRKGLIEGYNACTMSCTEE